MTGTHLTGLGGANPLGFLAALGVQEIFAKDESQPRLWWSDDITPYAILGGGIRLERIAAKASEVFANWGNSLAVNPKRADGSKMPKGDELKLKLEDIREYIRQATECGWSGNLASALLAEGSLDNNGAAKPSDFYFTAGQQKFLDTARKVLRAAVPEEVATGLEGPWDYKSEVPSLGWDVTDDRVYALRANNPSPEKKLTNPGVEALALLGLSRHPVFAGRDRTLTQGCSGKWKAGQYSWPIWHRPASPHAVKSLLAHAYDHPEVSVSRDAWYRSWGVSQIFRSPIRRTDQGGYGTFGPAEIVWSRSV